LNTPVIPNSKDAQFRDEALLYLSDVANFALSLTHDESRADDLVQETFLRGYRSWDQYASGTECRAWLFTICRHAWIRTRKREEREVVCDDADLEALGAAALHTGALQSGLGDLFERYDIQRALALALDTLPTAFREVVVLVDLEDQSYDDAARVLEIPIGTVRSRLFRARRLLQERLIEHARDAGLAVRDRGDEDIAAQADT
jgi:RNA polymerase sigma-70 factor (ECF subfamily)